MGNKRGVKVDNLASIFHFPDDLMAELMSEALLAASELGDERNEAEKWLGVSFAKAA